MDKNTIWALTLSLIVMIVAAVVNVKFMIPKQEAARQQQQIELAQKEAEEKEKAAKADEQISALSNDSSETQTESIEKLTDSELTITTNKVKVLFSQEGGDIVSYQLLEHLDKETGFGVQMADNITKNNRAFALSFGDYSGSILNDMFNVKKEGNNSIGFYRTYEIKDSLGNTHKYLIGKYYTFKEDDYAFKLDVTIKALDGNKELNVNGASYTIRTSPQIGPHYDPKKNRYDVRQFLEWSNNKKLRKGFSNKNYGRPYEWAGVGGKYFTILVKPKNLESMSSVVRASSVSESSYANSQVFLTRLPVLESSVTDEYYVYIGPRSETELIKYNSQDKNAWNLVNAKFNQALQTSGFLSVIEVALKWSLENIYKIVKNWGVAIIILTIILKILLFPLNKKSAVGTLKMQELQPKMQEIQSKYKDNPQKLNEETAKLYQQAGYNPVSGCLPMVFQMVILFALYNVFNNYFEFRGASFIKGWIDDLSVGDSVWSWKTNVPFISSFTMNNLRLLPIIYTVSQLLNGIITQYGGAGNSQSQAQMKFMMYGMPIMFFFLFYNVPSGLLLYWTVSNILQMGQQVVINNIMKKKKAEVAKSQKVVDKNTLKFKGGKKKTR